MLPFCSYYRYTSKMLLAAIDENHRGTYDFLYLPIDFKVNIVWKLVMGCLVRPCNNGSLVYRVSFSLAPCIGLLLIFLIFGFRINAMWGMPLSTWCLLLTLSPSMRFSFSPVYRIFHAI